MKIIKITLIAGALIVMASACTKRKCECTTGSNSTTTYFIDENISMSQAELECDEKDPFAYCVIKE